MTVDQGGPYDVVIANPPFGKVKDDKGVTRRYPLEGTSTTEIDYGISWRALQAMKDDGRAVLIIGGAKGDPTERRDSYREDARRPFFKKLYDTYNVVDHFTVDGKLYQRQGAGWPVDVIVIHGRGKSSLTLPMAEAPRVFGSWDELKGKLDDQDRLDTAGQPVGTGERPAAGTAGGAPDVAAISPAAGAADQPAGEKSGPGGRARPTGQVRGRGKAQPGAGAESGGLLAEYSEWLRQRAAFPPLGVEPPLKHSPETQEALEEETLEDFLALLYRDPDLT